MSICKYCGNPIEDEPVMNPDEYGNGYHHFCLVDKEFREEQKRIYNKGKADAFRWIPVSERLPENRNTVLIWNNDYSSYLLGYYKEDKTCPDNTGWYDEYHGFIHEEVTAWMPLPMPYKEGESE